MTKKLWLNKEQRDWAALLATLASVVVFWFLFWMVLG